MLRQMVAGAPAPDVAQITPAEGGGWAVDTLRPIAAIALSTEPPAEPVIFCPCTCEPRHTLGDPDVCLGLPDEESSVPPRDCPGCQPEVPEPRHSPETGA